MAGRRGKGSDYREYRAARQASGVLLFTLVVAMVLLDAFRADFDVNPLVLVPILLTGAALFAVDVPLSLPDRRPEPDPDDERKSEIEP